MKILVLGYMGYVGSHLMPKLSHHELRGWDIQSEGSIFDPQVDFLVEWADIVIHLAAKTSVQESLTHSEDYYYTNVLGTARIAQLCMQYKKKLIYLSSAARNDPYSSPYAFTKFLAEYLLEPFLKMMKIVILRPENIYGGIMKPGTLLYNFEFGEKLVVNGSGEQTRDFIHIQDMIEIIKASFSNKWNGKVVEVGTGKGISVNEIAQLFRKETGKRIVHHKGTPEVLHSAADTDLLKSLYGKKLQHNLKDYIKCVVYKHD